MTELRETTAKLAEKSIACETEFNAKLVEAVQKQFAVSEVVTQTKACPLQIKTLLTTITETTEWIWVNSRLDAQKHERSRRLHQMREKEQKFQELKSRIEASRSRLDAKRQSRKRKYFCPSDRETTRQVMIGDADTRSEAFASMTRRSVPLVPQGTNYRHHVVISFSCHFTSSVTERRMTVKLKANQADHRMENCRETVTLHNSRNKSWDLKYPSFHEHL
jgi:hypothetical protein